MASSSQAPLLKRAVASRPDPSVVFDNIPGANDNDDDNDKKKKSRCKVTDCFRSLALVLLGFAFAAIIVVGSIGLARSFGSITVTDVRVCGTLDLSCVDTVVPLPWFVPQPGPVVFNRRAVVPRAMPGFDYLVKSPPRHTNLILGNPASAVHVKFPARLLGYEGQTFHIYSNTSFEHTVSFSDEYDVPDAGEACRWGGATFDKARKHSVARFDGTPGAHLAFQVVACGSVITLTIHGVNMCPTTGPEACVSPTVGNFHVDTANVTQSLTAREAVIANVSGTMLSYSTLRVVTGSITNLTSDTIGAMTGVIRGLSSTTFEAVTGSIRALTCANGTFGSLFSVNGTFGSLSSTSASVGSLSATTLQAVSGTINTLASTVFSCGSATISTLSSTTISAGTAAVNTLSAAAMTCTSATITLLESVSATITTIMANDVTVSGSLRLTDMSKKIINVGPTRLYKTVSAALHQFNKLHVGDVEIRLDRGSYVDTINLGTNSSVSGSLSILGDTRSFIGTTFTVGRPSVSGENPDIFRYQVTTSVPGLGPFRAVGAEYDIETPSVSGSGQLYGDGPGGSATDGCTASAPGTFTGKIAIVERGTCDFVTKSTNAEAAGALATIVFQNVADDPVRFGLYQAVLRPRVSVMISRADATALLAGIAANSSLVITITQIAPSPVFWPPAFGDNALQVSTPGTNPDFSAWGVVPGDEVVISVDASTRMRRTVASMSGGMLVFTAPLNQQFSRVGTSLTFLPSVSIAPLPGSTAPGGMTVHSGSAVSVDGIRFLPDGGTNRGGVTIEHSSSATLARCVFDGSDFVVRQGSTASLPGGGGGGGGGCTSLNGMVHIHDNSHVRADTFHVLASIGPVSIQRASSLHVEGLFQTVWTGVIMSDASLTANTLAMSNYSSTLYPALYMDRQSRASISHMQFLGTGLDQTWIAAWLKHGSSLATEVFSARTHKTAIVAQDASRVSIANSTEYLSDNPELPKYQISPGSTYSEYARTSGSEEERIISHTRANSYLNHAHEIQTINNSTTPIFVWTGIQQESVVGYERLFVGRTFTLINLNSVAHTLDIGSSSRFVHVNANRYTFPIQPGSCIRFTVLSPTLVHVCVIPPSGTFSSSLPAKREVRSAEAAKEKEKEAEAMATEETLESVKPAYER